MPWEDSLEEFEKQLAEDRRREEDGRTSRQDRNHRKHQHHHRSHYRANDGDGHRHKRRRYSDEHEDEDGKKGGQRRSRHERDSSRRRSRDKVADKSDRGKKPNDDKPTQSPPQTALKRDAWMEAPSALEVDYVQRPAPPAQEPIRPGSPRTRYDLKIHAAELNKHHLQKFDDDVETQTDALLKTDLERHDVDYEFGDSGSQWRMARLKNVYRQAKEESQEVETVAMKQFGSLRAFDDAREEEIEIDRRQTYGEGYVSKTKPSGELFQERKLDAGVHRKVASHEDIRRSGAMDDRDAGREDLESTTPVIRTMDENEPSARTAALDSTALNRLRAQMLKAKLKGLPEAMQLERDYDIAQKSAEASSENGVVVLGVMENRMLAGGRRGEVKEVINRRGQERGNVEENEDMSIEDMVREERRTKGLFGNEGKRLAERIANDAKFDNDLEYMDENANKLAKRVHQSDTALRNSAIAAHKLNNSVLASCPLCYHEDRPSDPLPTAPIVSLAHRVYLTIPTTPEISPYGGAVIVPLTHHINLLHCDDDEWEEIRNFQKSLTRMYHSRNLGVLFYENAAYQRKKRHAALVAVALPLGSADDAPAFFREAILASDNEWTQHRKLIDTRGKGKNGFRRSLAKEMPYFHVWTEMDGGLAHVIEDERRWPQGDLFAREVLGGMLRVRAETWRKQGKWERGGETPMRVEKFRKGWKAYDWTRVLVEGGEAV